MARNTSRAKQKSSPLPWILLTVVLAVLGINMINSNGLKNNPPIATPDDNYDGVCYIVGNVANSPAPNLSNTTDYIKTVLNATKTDTAPNICMYSATADPYAIELEGIEPKAGSTSGVDSQAKKITSSIDNASKTSPAKSGANYFDAIREAASYLKSNGSSRPLVIVYGSGLSDDGVLNFAFDGHLLSEKSSDLPKYVSNKLANNSIRKESLSNVTIEWYGAGKVVNENGQEDLGPDNIEKVKVVYENSLKYVGANINQNSFHDANVYSSTSSVGNTLMVNPTRKPGAIKPGVIIHLDERKAKFNPNQATLVSRETVVNELTSFAEEFNKAPSLRMKITGYHAKCGGGQDPGLSKRRAEAIKDIFINNLNVDSGRIETFGVGGPQDDRDEGQNCVNAEIAAEHRVVIVETY